MAKQLWTRKQQSGRTWQVKPTTSDISELAAKLKMPRLIAQLLHNRGIDTPEQAQQFLAPSLGDLVDPSQFRDMKKAIARIRQALQDQEQIVIYGDYDVDGITGTAILWRCFHLAGVDVATYMPHRIDEGYGLNSEAIRNLADKGAQLIVTVDCGITAHEEANLAAELGVDLIITDHHKIEGPLPEAVAIVHPNLPDQDYPNPDLCGAGVAFKLAWGLAQSLSGTQKVTPEFREFLISATGLAALGTIADVVPLQGENRIIAKFGMQCFAQSTDLGIQALLEASNLTGSKLQSSDVGFQLAPKLNAAGRMGHARLALELFTKSTETRARQIAAYLESQNQQRRKVEKAIADEAKDQVKALGMDKAEWRGLVLAGESWHAGVIGIVASRIVDKYHRPTIIISIADQNKAQGSCRSVPGFDICKALDACSEHLLGYGGHTMAAGLTIEPDKIEAFRQAFNAYATDHMLEEHLIPSIDIDAEVKISELDIKTIEMVERLGPFGAGNPETRLVARNLKLVNPPRTMGRNGDHLQLTVTHNDSLAPHLQAGQMMRAVAFRKAKWEKKLIDAERIDLVFEPVINRYNGSTTVEMIVEDIQVHDE